MHERQHLAGLCDISIFQWSQNLKPKQTNENCLMQMEAFHSDKSNEVYFVSRMRTWWKMLEAKVCWETCEQQKHSYMKSSGIGLGDFSSNSVGNVIPIRCISQYGKEYANTCFQINDAGQNFIEETFGKTHTRRDSWRDSICTSYYGQFQCICSSWFFCDT